MKKIAISIFVCLMSLTVSAQDAKVMARYVPERFDDFVWENSYVCHRMYGKALEGNPTTPGVDIWVKRPGALIANKLYKNELELGKSYHIDWGDGKDCYKVARTLGGGGAALIIDGAICYPATNYRSWEINEQDNEHITFTLHYPEWEYNGEKISYDKQITVYADSYFSKSTDTFHFSGNAGETLKVAAGIIMHDVVDSFKGDDRISIWEHASDPCKEPEDGMIGISVYFPGTEVSEIEGHLVCTRPVTSGESVTYWFGSCWSKGAVKTSADWFRMLKEFTPISTFRPAERYSLEAGEVVEIPDGVYKDVVMTVSGHGTAGKPAVFKAEHPGKVVFKGASAITVEGEYVDCEGFLFNDLDTSFPSSILTCRSGSHDCSFKDCMIDGTSSAISEVDTKWVSLYGSHNEVSNCTFIDKRNMGCLFVVWLEPGVIPEHRILNNYFTRPYTHLNARGGAMNGQESLRIGTSTYSMQDARCYVAGNHFHFCNGERNEIISNKSCENVFENNLFEDGIGTLTLRHGNRCVVRGNYFLSNGMKDVGGIRVIGESHLVENNVMMNLTGDAYKAAFSVVMGEPDAPLNGYWTVLNTTVRNNIFLNCRCNMDINVKSRRTQHNAPDNLTIKGNTIICWNNDIAVRVNDTPAGNIKWSSNKIYGGSISGASLKKKSTSPKEYDFTTEMQMIREHAGAGWYQNQ